MKRLFFTVLALVFVASYAARSEVNVSTPPTVNIASSGTAITNTAGAIDINVKSSSISNQTVNQAQIGGSSYALGSAAMAASAPSVMATNQANPCQNPNATLSAAAGATSGTSLTQLIALSAGKQIFICSITLTTVSGTTPNYELEYGTATNCGSGTTALVGPSATVTAGTIIVYQNAFIVPASNALCYKMGVTTPVFDYAIVYVQQ